MREAEVASEVRKRGEEVVTFHLSSRVPFCASWSGMVIPVTSLPCGEKNLLALPQISCKSERRSDSPQSVTSSTSLLASSNLLPHAMTALSDLCLGTH